MIARLRGRPVGRSADGLVLDVNGVGYLVAATPSVVRRAGAGSELTVETYLHVRDDALQLYGFADAEERELFVHLLTVSGVGPKVALAVVSGSPVGELRKAIAMGDHARFQAIPGIGKKTAERIVLESDGRIRALAQGCWTSGARERPELRLRRIFEGVGMLIAEHEPDAVAPDEQRGVQLLARRSPRRPTAFEREQVDDVHRASVVEPPR
jgi:Holliday junction DNA helicase RuvA